MDNIFFDVLDKSRAIDRLHKSIMPDTTAEILEKGKRAEIGEVRTWGGYKYQKTQNGWVPFKEGTKPSTAPKGEDRSKEELTKLGFKKYTEGGETWFEKEHNGQLIRVVQEEPGKNDFWEAKLGSKSLLNADGKAMSFESPVEAAHEAIDSIDNKSKGKENSTTELTKEGVEKRIKEIENEQDQIEETTQKNLLAIFKEELGPETDVKFAYPGERAEIYFGKGLWDSIIVKYSHLDRFTGDAGERKFGISVGVGSKTIEPGSSYAKIISLANKLLTDTGLSDKVKSELINYQEAGHKLFKEHRELASKLREIKNK